MFVSFVPPETGSGLQGLYGVPEGPSQKLPTCAEVTSCGAGVVQLFPLMTAQPIHACLMEMLRKPPTYTGAFTDDWLAIQRFPPTYSGTVTLTPWPSDVSQPAVGPSGE